MCLFFTVLKKRNHCYLSSKKVAYKKNIEQRLVTNTASKNVIDSKWKWKVACKSIFEFLIMGKKAKERKKKYSKL